MWNKLFLSPFFTPIAFILCWSLEIFSVCSLHPQEILQQTLDGAFIDVVAKIGYIFLVVLLFFLYRDFENKMLSWGIYIFLTIGCFLRESGIQHCLSKTDTTPFKSRFFLNPENPMYEKILFGLVLLLILGVIAYLAVKYAKHLVKSFFKLDTVTWTIAVLCVTGVVSKIIDRYPSNYRKAHGGVSLPEDVYAVFQLVEELSEMFLPYLAMLALLQFHFLNKKQAN